MYKKGFTLIEVIVVLGIIMIVGLMMAYSYTNSLKLSKDLYLKEQTKLSLIEYINYCADNNMLPEVIEGDQIYKELHIDGKNLYNDGITTKFTTFFGPIDINTIDIYSYNGVNWVPIVFSSATESGAIIVQGVHTKISISYKVFGWDYIKDRRYNYGTTMILSYVRPTIASAVTDDGVDVPLSNINIFNAEEGRIVISSSVNKWINIYYKSPRDIIFQIYRPNVENYSFSGNIITFNSPAMNHYILVNYRTISNINRRDIVKISSLNQAMVSDTISVINNIQCLTIEGIADWESGKYRKKIGYIMMVRQND